MQSAFVIATCSRTATPSCQPRLSTAIGGAELHLHADSVAPGSSTSAVHGQVGKLYRAVPTRLQRADSVLPNARCSTATLCRYSMRVRVPRQLKWRIACAECASTAGRWGVCAGPHRPSQAGVVPCMQLPCGTQGPVNGCATLHSTAADSHLELHRPQGEVGCWSVNMTVVYKVPPASCRLIVCAKVECFALRPASRTAHA